MTLDPEVDAAYPKRWIGKVTIKTTDGRTLHGQLDEPKGDPGNTLSRDELAEKAQRLAAYSQSVSADDMTRLIEQVWRLSAAPKIGFFLS
jgi:2-methylcitrate dehydratase PrpD